MAAGANTARRGEHGSLGVCVCPGGLVLVSQDGARWELPAGRPEPGETPEETLVREVAEEACCAVTHARYVGTTISRCLDGDEAGKVLVRTHWAANVELGPWQPRHETTHRSVVAWADVLDRLSPAALRPVHATILDAARAALDAAGPQVTTAGRRPRG